MERQIGEKQIAERFQGMDDSIVVINELIFDSSGVDKTELLKAQANYLEIMLAKDFIISSEKDKQPYIDALNLALGHLSVG
jgi:hypothetical protein